MSKYFPAVLLLLFASVAFSQETQVSLDENGKIEVIDNELELKLQLFPNANNFKQAVLFQLRDSSFVLEISYQSDGKTMKTRQPLTMVEAQKLRARISKTLQELAPTAGLNQEGRSTFIGTIYSLSFGYYGWGIPYVLDIHDGRVFAGMYLLMSGGAIFAAHGATENVEITPEAASSFTFGSYMGIAHGILLHGIIFGDDATTRGYVASGILGGLAEGIAGFKIANRLKPSSSSLELIGSTSAFGILYGLGTSYIADIDKQRPFFTTMLAGSVIGIATGAWLSSSQHYTSGDVAVFQMGSLLGAYLPVTILKATENDNNKDYTTAAMLGGLVGGTLGHLMLADKDFTTAEGGFVSLAALGAGTLGLGFSVLLNLNDKVIFPVTGVAALIGYGAMYSHYAQSARTRASETSLNFSIHPEGLLALAQGRNLSLQSRMVVPIARAVYHF